MTQPPVQPPTWGQPGAPTGSPAWQQPAAAPGWQPPGQPPPVPRQPTAPAWEQRPGPPVGPPPGGLFQPPPPPAPRSRRGLWWAIGSAVLALLVAGGVLFFVLTGGVDAPSGVSAAVQDDGVLVSWSAVDGATGYEVFRDDTSVGTTDRTSFLDAEAPGGTEVAYTVRASNADGDESELSSATTGVLTPVDAPAPTASADGGVVQLTWGAVNGAETYQVSRDGTALAGDLTETTFLDQDAPLGDHAYEVTAVDADGAGSTATGTVQIFSPGPWGTPTRSRCSSPTWSVTPLARRPGTGRPAAPTWSRARRR